MGNFNKEKATWSTEKIPPETAKRVRKTLDGLRDEGYEFEYGETPDEFILRFAHPPKETHLNKMDPFPLEHDGKTEHVTLEDALRARVINPDGSLYDTMHSEKFGNKPRSGKSRPQEFYRQKKSG